MQPLTLLTAVALFVIGLFSTAGYAYARGRRSSQRSWNDLLARLALIDHDSIALVALDLVDETGAPRQADEAATLEPTTLWTLIGGLTGLERLEANSEVLIDMAAYLQRWYPEAGMIAEQLRRDAGELKWHVARLRGAAEKGNLQISFPFYAQRAVVSYYLMTRRVLELYRLGNFSLLADPHGALQSQ